MSFLSKASFSKISLYPMIHLQEFSPYYSLYLQGILFLRRLHLLSDFSRIIKSSSCFVLTSSSSILSLICTSKTVPYLKFNSARMKNFLFYLYRICRIYCSKTEATVTFTIKPRILHLKCNIYHLHIKTSFNNPIHSSFLYLFRASNM